MNQPPLDIRISPNKTYGRQGTPVRKITFHHTVASALSAVQRFLNPSSGTSAHFIVTPSKIYCCVDTDDTAWTNGKWASNLESVTIEHEGDWRFGYYNQGVIDQSAILVAWLRSLYPEATPNRHREIVATACPGDLPVELIWNKATEILYPPLPVPVVVPEPVVVPTPAPIPEPIPVPTPVPIVIPEPVVAPPPVEPPPIIVEPIIVLPIALKRSIIVMFIEWLIKFFKKG